MCISHCTHVPCIHRLPSRPRCACMHYHAPPPRRPHRSASHHRRHHIHSIAPHRHRSHVSLPASGHAAAMRTRASPSLVCKVASPGHRHTQHTPRSTTSPAVPHVHHNPLLTAPPQRLGHAPSAIQVLPPRFLYHRSTVPTSRVNASRHLPPPHRSTASGCERAAAALLPLRSLHDGSANPCHHACQPCMRARGRAAAPPCLCSQRREVMVPCGPSWWRRVRAAGARS